MTDWFQARLLLAPPARVGAIKLGVLPRPNLVWLTHCNWTSGQLRLDARTPVRMDSNDSACVIFWITTLLWPFGMQVVDLKKQLKDWGLLDDGLKAALQKRLKEAIAATGGGSGGGSGSG